MENPTAVVMGSEPVMHGDTVLGFVTSADYGYTVGKSIAYAYLPAEYTEQGTRLDIVYFDKRYAASVVEDSLYDPTGARMRA
jgi:glycine cleavage system aminomethyltransferase T